MRKKGKRKKEGCQLSCLFLSKFTRWVTILCPTSATAYSMYDICHDPPLSDAFSFICNQRTRLAVMIRNAPNTEDVYKTNELHRVQSSARNKQSLSYPRYSQPFMQPDDFFP